MEMNLETKTPLKEETTLKDYHNFEQVGQEEGGAAPKKDSNDIPAQDETDGESREVQNVPQVDSPPDKAKDEEDGIPDEVNLAPDPNKESLYKPIKATLPNGDEVELDTNAIIKHKIDGKEQEFSLHDVIDGFTGEVALKPRFAEANKIKQRAESALKKVDQERQELIETLTEVESAAKEGKIDDALYLFSKLANVDPMAIIDVFDKAKEQAWQQMRDMSDDEYRVHKTEEENRRMRELRQRDLDEQRRLQDRETQRQEMAQVLDKYRLTTDELLAESDYYDYQVKRREINPKDMPKTLDLLGFRASRAKLMRDIQAEIPNYFKFPIDRDGRSITEQEFMNDLIADISRNPDLTKEDWLEMAKEAKSLAEQKRDKKTARSLSKKVQERTQETNARRADGGAPALRDIWSFDDV